jgi:hypothetical protein
MVPKQITRAISEEMLSDMLSEALGGPVRPGGIFSGVGALKQHEGSQGGAQRFYEDGA